MSKEQILLDLGFEKKSESRYENSDFFIVTLQLNDKFLIDSYNELTKRYKCLFHGRTDSDDNFKMILESVGVRKCFKDMSVSDFINEYVIKTFSSHPSYNYWNDEFQDVISIKSDERDFNFYIYGDSVMVCIFTEDYTSLYNTIFTSEISGKDITTINMLLHPNSFLKSKLDALCKLTIISSNLIDESRGEEKELYWDIKTKNHRMILWIWDVMVDDSEINSFVKLYDVNSDIENSEPFFTTSGTFEHVINPIINIENKL